MIYFNKLNKMDESKLVSVSTLWEGKWLKVVGKDYQLAEGKHELWECIERPRRQGPCDGVDAFATFEQNGEEKIILIGIYRPPVEMMVLETPAGLCDGDEDPALCAIRELAEETGYKATQEDVEYVSPLLYVDPWKSNETSRIARIKLNMELPENQNPTPAPEHDENIRVLIFDHKNLL